MKMKLVKNKKYLQQKFSQKVLVPQTTADLTSWVGKSYVPFTYKFPMVMHFLPIFHKRCRSKTNFYVFIYDKASLKFSAGFRIFLAVFIEKFQKIHYLNYVRRGINADQGTTVNVQTSMKKRLNLSLNLDKSNNYSAITITKSDQLTPVQQSTRAFPEIEEVSLGQP